LELGRMVVLGEAGAGKTVMVLRLLLDLAGEALAALDVEPRTKVRVPVRLSLSSFHVEPEVLEPTALRTRLDSWIARQLTRAHGIPHGQARALVSEGWVLPVLDGLDEMAPSRVEQLVAALNCPVGPTPGPVVLTSRTTAYVERVERSGKAAIEDVTVVTVRPLDIESVVAWLAHRFPDPARPDRVQQRWRRVVTTIRRHPGGRLARCLISPLNLYLATAVYADPHSTPAKLCDHDTGDPTRHLLDHLIPAVARHHPGSDGSHYRPDQVRTWLTTITRHLEVMARSGYSGTDFHLHHLWMSVGRSGRWIRLPVAAIVTVPVIGALALVVAPVLTSGTGLPARALTMALAAGFLAVVVLEARSPKLGVLPRLALPRLRDPKARSRVAYAIVMGILAGLATGLVQGAVIGTVVGAAVSQLAALLFGLFSATPQAQRPSDTLRAAIAYTITLGLSAASLFALVGGLALGVPHGTAVGLVTAVTIALAIGTGFGVAPYSPNLPGVWLVRYVLAVGVLHRRGLLPRHPQRFLDWAHTAGLLRLAGTAAQFRHRTIQTLLATVPEHPSEGFH
jgi:hypothetical protein